MWGINVLVDSDAFFSCKFENWIYKIENKEFELENLIVVTKMSQLEILKFELLNIKILKNWKLKSLCEMSGRNLKIWKLRCLNTENWKLKCLNIENWKLKCLNIEN